MKKITLMVSDAQLKLLAQYRELDSQLDLLLDRKTYHFSDEIILSNAITDALEIRIVRLQYMLSCPEQIREAQRRVCGEQTHESAESKRMSSQLMRIIIVDRDRELLAELQRNRAEMGLPIVEDEIELACALSLGLEEIVKRQRKGLAMRNVGMRACEL